MAVVPEKRVRDLPVLEDRRLIGPVWIGDVIEDRIEELRLPFRQIEDHISGCAGFRAQAQGRTDRLAAAVENA